MQLVEGQAASGSSPSTTRTSRKTPSPSSDNLGNPYAAIGVDEKGSATIDWGVYGVPESFLVTPDGEILYKQTGPFSPESIQNGLMPALEQALKREPKARTPTS